MTKAEKLAAQQDARCQLLELVPPGTTVYTTLKTANSAGTSRTMTVFVIDHGSSDEKPRAHRINYLLARVGIGRLTTSGALQVSGGGMDMGWATVHDLASVLYPNNAEALRSIRHEWI